MWLTFGDLLTLPFEVQITHIITCSPSLQGRVNDYQNVFLHMLWSGHIFCMAKYFTVSFVNIYKIDCKDIHKKIHKHYTPQVILSAVRISYIQLICFLYFVVLHQFLSLFIFVTTMKAQFFVFQFNLVQNIPKDLLSLDLNEIDLWNQQIKSIIKYGYEFF